MPGLRRTLTTSSGRAPLRASSRPLRTVLIAIPVARATATTPPCPSAPASVPAQSRRARSSMVALSRRHFWRTDFSASTSNVDHAKAWRVDPQRSISTANRSTHLFEAPKRLPRFVAERHLTPLAAVGRAEHTAHVALLHVELARVTSTSSHRRPSNSPRLRPVRSATMIIVRHSPSAWAISRSDCGAAGSAPGGSPLASKVTPTPAMAP